MQFDAIRLMETCASHSYRGERFCFTGGRRVEGFNRGGCFYIDVPVFVLFGKGGESVLN
jgi:hypothetical protein